MRSPGSRFLTPGRALSLAALTWLPGAALLEGCLPSRPQGDVSRLGDREDGGAGGPATVDAGIAPPGRDAAAPLADPHAVSGVSPGHGPFAGGLRAIIDGNGFAFKPRVWFGDAEVSPPSISAVSTKKLQVQVPPGAPGPTDVKVQNGDDASTLRVLKGAFTYDSFYADPPKGPTSGGTVVTLHGAGTAFGPGVKVSIGGKDCGSVMVAGPGSLSCVTPPAPAGSQPVTVTTPDGAAATVLDGFVYANTDNGFKGGLSGSPLAGSLRVLGFNSYTGEALSGATVFAGPLSDGSWKTATLDDAGVALLTGDFLHAPVTVTMARTCSQPTTFVAVPVDTVTMYLDPIVSPACAPPMGDPPPTGGNPGAPAQVEGQVTFPQQQEFKRAPWSVIPSPASMTERKVVYLFPAVSDPKTPFALPDPSMAVTEMSAGTVGYSFSLPHAPVGNLSLYALAGIEDSSKSPLAFTAYAFGVLQGISTKPGETTSDVLVSIESTLDQAITLGLQPPAAGAKGPDRLLSAVAVSLGLDAYAVFPGARRTSLLPLAGEVSFAGLPPLSNSLAGSSYVATAESATGDALAPPLSVIGRYATTNSATTVQLDAFVAIPSLEAPAAAITWDGLHYAVSFPNPGLSPDLLVFDVESGGGLVSWTIASPASVSSFVVPDLRKIKDASLLAGPITATVTAAHIADLAGASVIPFDYGNLRYRHLDRRGWAAYGQDVFFAQLPP